MDNGNHLNLSIEDIFGILKAFDESACDVLRLESESVRLEIRRQGADSPGEISSPAGHESARLVTTAPPPAPAPVAEPDAEPTAASPAAGTLIHEASGVAEQLPENVVSVSAPMYGTFYRASSPEAAPFVQPGDVVSESDTIGLIEVMKLFNSIKAGVNGKVVKFLVENATVVEYGDHVVLIEVAS